MAENTQTYREHEISLTSEWVFEVSGEAFPGEARKKFPSLMAAKEAIDANVEALAKQKKTQISLNLPALSSC